MEETIASPLLVDKTPDTGLTLAVWAGEGGLAGLRLLQQQDGPPVTVELSTDSGGTWGGVPYPYALQAGDLLRLTRTDDSPALSVLHATVPAPAAATGGTGGGTTTTTALFTARLRDSGPDLALLNTASGTRDVRGVYTMSPDSQYRVVSEIRVQVPDGASLPSGAVTVATGYPERTAPVLGTSIMQADGRTWLSVQVALALPPGERLKLRFSSAYTVVTGAVSSNASSMDIETDLGGGKMLSGAAPSLVVVSAGPRNVAGMIAPDAFPFTNYPSASLPNGGVELVAADGSPYLRTVINDQEYRVALTPYTP